MAANNTTMGGATFIDTDIQQSLILKYWRLFPCPPPWEAYETLKDVQWSRLGEYGTLIYEDFLQRCEVIIAEDNFVTSEVLRESACDHVCRTAIIIVCSFFIVFSCLAVVCVIHRRRREGCSMTEVSKRSRQLTHDIRNFRFRKKKCPPMLPDSNALNGTRRNDFADDEEQTSMLQPDVNNTTFTSTEDSLLPANQTISSYKSTPVHSSRDTGIYECINDDSIYSDPELIRKRYTLPPPESMQKQRHKHRFPVILPLPKDLKVPADKSFRITRPFSSSRAVNSDYNLVVYENTKHGFFDPPKSVTHLGLSSIGDGYLSPQESPKHFSPTLKSSQFDRNHEKGKTRIYSDDEVLKQPTNYIEKVFYDSVRNASRNNMEISPNSSQYVTDKSQDNNDYPHKNTNLNDGSNISKSTHTYNPYSKLPQYKQRYRDPELLYSPNRYYTTSIQRHVHDSKPSAIPAPTYSRYAQRNEFLYGSDIEPDSALRDYYTQQAYRSHSRTHSLEKQPKTERSSFTPVDSRLNSMEKVRKSESFRQSKANSVEKLPKSESFRHGMTSSIEKLPKTESFRNYRTGSTEKLPKTESFRANRSASTEKVPRTERSSSMNRSADSPIEFYRNKTNPLEKHRKNDRDAHKTSFIPIHNPKTNTLEKHAKYERSFSPINPVHPQTSFKPVHRTTDNKSHRNNSIEKLPHTERVSPFRPAYTEYSPSVYPNQRFTPIVHSTPVKMFNHPQGGQLYLQETMFGPGNRRGTFYTSHQGCHDSADSRLV